MKLTVSGMVGLDSGFAGFASPGLFAGIKSVGWHIMSEGSEVQSGRHTSEGTIPNRVFAGLTPSRASLELR